MEHAKTITSEGLLQKVLEVSNDDEKNSGNVKHFGEMMIVWYPIGFRNWHGLQFSTLLERVCKYSGVAVVA